jgi:hypothetical protein
MPKGVDTMSYIAKRAFHKARAAYSENFKPHGDFSVAIGGAHIALIDAGIKFLSPLYVELFESVQACVRPSVERRLCQLESHSAQYNDEEF